MELDPTRMCELLVGLPAVRVLDVRGDGPVAGACGDESGAASLRRLRRSGVGEGPPGRGVGGPAVLRTPDAPGVAQAPLGGARAGRVGPGRGPRTCPKSLRRAWR